MTSHPPHLPPGGNRARLALVLTHLLDLPDMLPMLSGIFPKGVRFMTIDTTGSLLDDLAGGDS